MMFLRLLAFLVYAVVAVIMLFFVCNSRQNRFPINSTQSPASRRLFKNFSSFRIPAVLFPPSALISLTDDNATFFVARPAAFGPLVPEDGLNGRLWAASASREHISESAGNLDGIDGELGCSDVPGWNGLASNVHESIKNHDELRRNNDDGLQSKEKHDAEDRQASQVIAQGYCIRKDETNETILRQQSNRGESFRKLLQGQPEKLAPHADIQSAEESAEISGKIVLLSRGGCGFVEKVKWAQRRGSIAVIVGDDIPGRALVTMFARGDTSNITIPALFTTHTTAQFLSSLIPYRGLQRSASEYDKIDRKLSVDTICKQSQIATPYCQDWVEESSESSHYTSKGLNAIWEKPRFDKSLHNESFLVFLTSTWRALLQDLGIITIRNTVNKQDSLSQRSVDIDLGEPGNNNQKYTDMSLQDVKNVRAISPTTNTVETDRYITGMKESTDYDIFENSNGPAIATARLDEQMGPEGKTQHQDSTASHELQSNTPDSSEYEGGNMKGEDRHARNDRSRWTNQEDSAAGPPRKVENVNYYRNGLWVTITPAKVSSSPFFDTLLILVVSPLVTLMVVYALLLLRTRLYHRRWRAPKSLVERLPVRTYRTFPNDSSSQQSSQTTPLAVSATTPLLTAVSGPASTTRHFRPSSTSNGRQCSSQRGADGDDESRMSQHRSYLSGPCFERDEDDEKKASLERKRYFDLRQRECVICLEDYVHGISQVMSLPCGHDFHAECITPWLTTRRRTCPICKDDVVRYLTYGLSWKSHYTATDDCSIAENGSSEYAGGRHGSVISARTYDNDSDRLTDQREREGGHAGTEGSDRTTTPTGERSSFISRVTDGGDIYTDRVGLLSSTVASLRMFIYRWLGNDP